MLQGEHRLERGNIYYNYLAHYYSDTVYSKHTKFIVPGVGHSSSEMFSSTAGAYYLFDYRITRVDKFKTNRPESFRLMQNYPNPFNSQTTIVFVLKKKSQVSLVIFDVLGKQITSLLKNEILSPGGYKTIWDASNFPSGIYFYKLRTIDGFYAMKKMVLLK